MSEFQEKLVLIIVQYLAVGLIVAFAGYLFSKSLEHYKAREAVFGEFAKQRIKVIAECWSEMYKLEATLNSFIRRAAELQLEHSGNVAQLQTAMQNELAPVEDKSKAQASAAHAKVEESRFWLGEDLYSKFRDYNNFLMEYGSAFVKGDLQKFKSLESKIKCLKGNLSKELVKVS